MVAVRARIALVERWDAVEHRGGEGGSRERTDQVDTVLWRQYEGKPIFFGVDLLRAATTANIIMHEYNRQFYPQSHIRSTASYQEAAKEEKVQERDKDTKYTIVAK